MTTLQVGRVALMERESADEKADGGSRSVSMLGKEWGRVLGNAVPRTRGAGLLGHAGMVVPVAWARQSHRDGWYVVTGPAAIEVTQDDGWSAVRWTADLELVGLDGDVEVESRLTGGNRLHASSATAELWHAPAVAADGYLTGTATPGYVDRVSADGTVRVYRSLPAGEHPRWAIPAADALDGAVNVTLGGVLQTGLTGPDTPTDWVVSNGMVRVQPRTTAGTVRVTSYLASAWGTPKVFDVKRGTTSLGAADHVTILRNDFCECVIRLSWDHAPGRTVADLTLARGARHVGLYVQQYEASSSLRVDDTAGSGTVDDQLTASGYIELTTVDGDGNGWVLGSAQACTAAGTFGLTADVAALGLSGFIGCVRGGGSAQAGDTAAQVNAQWLGQPAQSERVVRR